jgi:hypothetical protein
MGNVRKDNKSEDSKLPSTIDEVYISVSEKTNTNKNQTKEAIVQIREYVDDKFRAVSGDMRQVIKMPIKFQMRRPCWGAAEQSNIGTIQHPSIS